MDTDPDPLALLTAIVRDSDDAIVTRTLDGVVTSWNPAAERIFGFTATEMIGRPITALFPADRVAEERELLARLSRGEHVGHHETVGRRKNGGSVDVSVSLSPLRDAAGTLVGVSAIARDITERNRGRARRRRQTEFWLAALACVGDGVIVTDAGQRVVFMNVRAEALTGWSGDAGAGRALSEVFVVLHEDTRSLGQGAADRALAERRTVKLADHATLVSRDGPVHPIDQCATPIRAPDGAVIGVLLVFSDCTERRRLEAEEARVLAEERTARADAERVNRTKDEFLVMLAHELRNPLSAILNAVAALDRIGSISPVAVRLRGIIRRQTEQLASLLEEVLDVARIGRRKLELHLEPLDLRTVVRHAFDANQHRFEVRRQRTMLSVPAEPVLVLGNPVRTQQIVSNLLVNAAKYTPPGGLVTIAVTVEGADAVARVRDTGMGIPPERLGEIFELFTQLDAPEGRTEGGLGIGLTLVKQLTALHGGTVTALSGGPGTGSEFVVRLPWLAGTPAEPEPAAAPARAARQRILIIDDDEDAREGLAMLLEADGHRVFAAGSGREGLEVAVVERPTIVIVDIGLPDMAGHEVARRLRHALQAGTVLVAYSGYGQPQDRRRSLEAGFDAHVVKPATSEAILSVLAGHARLGPAA